MKIAQSKFSIQVRTSLILFAFVFITSCGSLMTPQVRDIGIDVADKSLAYSIKSLPNESLLTKGAIDSFDWEYLSSLISYLKRKGYKTDTLNCGLVYQINKPLIELAHIQNSKFPIENDSIITDQVSADLGSILSGGGLTHFVHEKIIMPESFQIADLDAAGRPPVPVDPKAPAWNTRKRFAYQRLGLNTHHLLNLADDLAYLVSEKIDSLIDADVRNHPELIEKLAGNKYK